MLTIKSLKIGTTESDISDAIIKGRMHNFLKSFETCYWYRNW
mgnify:CR=1 FL=1